MARTSTGLEGNVAGLLCYVLLWVSGIIFLLIEPENRFVRFHAIQSIIVFGILNVIQVVVSWIPWVNLILGPIVGIITFILWIVLMVKAYQGTKYKLPWAGNLAEKWAEGQKE